MATEQNEIKRAEWRKKNLSKNSSLANDSARYIVVDESVSNHCCFRHTVIDTSAGKVSYGDYWKRSMCETFDRAEAEIICDALNKHCR